MQLLGSHFKGIQTMRSTVLILMLASCTAAQTVRIDATPGHVANTFSPIRALGTTLDRIPSNTTDIFFRPDQIKQVLEAGWGPITYRQIRNCSFKPGIGIRKGGGAIL